jgi:hypothetical protein
MIEQIIGEKKVIASKLSVHKTGSGFSSKIFLCDLAGKILIFILRCKQNILVIGNEKSALIWEFLIVPDKFINRTRMTQI